MRGGLVWAFKERVVAQAEREHRSEAGGPRRRGGGRRRGRLPVVALAGAGVVALVVVSGGGGCQSYEPRPLDLPGHAGSFLSRRAGDAEAVAHAATMGRVFDPSDGLSLAEGEVVALVYNGEARAARARALNCVACVGAAGAWEDPTFGVDLARIVESVAEPWKIAGAVGLTVPISGRLRLDRLHAEAEQAAEVMRAVRTEWGVRMGLRRAWIAWSSARSRAEVTAAALAWCDEIVRIVSEQERLGAVSRAEANVYRIERAMLDLELDRLRSAERRGELEVLRIMGLPPPSGSPGEASLGAGLVPWGIDEVSPAAVGSEALRARLLSGNADTAVASAEYAVAERLLEWEIRKQYPDIEIGPGVAEEDGLGEVRLGLSVRLPIFNRNKRGIAEARTARDGLHAEVLAMVERLIGALAQAEDRHASAGAVMASIRDSAIPLVEQQAGMVRRLLTLGEANMLVLLETLQQERRVRVELVEARAEVALASVDLAELAGPDLLALMGPVPSGMVGHAGQPGSHGAAGDPACKCPECVAARRANPEEHGAETPRSENP